MSFRSAALLRYYGFANVRRNYCRRCYRGFVLAVEEHVVYHCTRDSRSVPATTFPFIRLPYKKIIYARPCFSRPLILLTVVYVPANKPYADIRIFPNKDKKKLWITFAVFHFPVRVGKTVPPLPPQLPFKHSCRITKLFRYVASS